MIKIKPRTRPCVMWVGGLPSYLCLPVSLIPLFFHAVDSLECVGEWGGRLGLPCGGVGLFVFLSVARLFSLFSDSGGSLHTWVCVWRYAHARVRKPFGCSSFWACCFCGCLLVVFLYLQYSTFFLCFACLSCCFHTLALRPVLVLYM